MSGEVTTALLERPHPGHAPVQHARGDRIGALDGLRAVAVLAVVSFHLWPDAVPAGFLGVDLFMVLSGFLITGLLVEGRARDGAIRFGAFWGRRFSRLVPALLALITGVALWVRIAGPSALAPAVRGQGLASLVYLGNWKLIHDGTSYAALAGPQSPLLHLWSLAIEEQFYVLWPLVVATALVRGTRPLVRVAVAGAVASAALMAMWFEPGHDPLRLYFGTDTRAFAFLIGGVAFVAARRVRVGRTGVAALAVLLVAFVARDSDRVLYQGGFAAFALVAAVVVVAAAQRGPVAAVLDRVPLRVIGRVSYGIYLWHWPVIVFVTGTWLRLLLTAGFTTISWFVIEQPYRRASRSVAVVAAVAGFAVALVAVTTLPRASTVAYATVDVSHVPAPTVAALGASASTVMIVGDSGMYDAVPALTAGLGSTGARVVSTAYPGEGLTQPAGLRDAWAQTVDEYRPDLVIVMIGAWDYDFVAAKGDAAYTRVVDDTVAMFTSKGAHLLWLSVLPGDAVVPGKRVPASQLDRFFAALPARHPGVVDYVDITPALTPRDGVLLRKPDQWHLCPDGAAAIAAAALSEAGVSSTAWVTGDWRHDARYDDPPGGCPAR